MTPVMPAPEDALKAVRHALLGHSVVERRFYWQLLRGWLVAAYPHRSLWPLPPASTAPVQQARS